MLADTDTVPIQY
jgi:hypothetical protein